MKTPTQEFIESAVWIYRACCDLDQGAASTHEVGRLAGNAFDRLDRDLTRMLCEWNENIELGEQAVYECVGAQTDAKGCEIYTTNPPCDHGEVLCDVCNARAYDRHQGQLMESGGHDESKYRQDMRDAGRGHLLR